MKIEIKLNSEALVIIGNSVQSLYISKINDNKWFNKLMMSIALELLEKVDTKGIKLINRVDQSKTNAKLSLRRHQAMLLQKVLQVQVEIVDNHYSRLIIQSIIDQLDEKLA